MDLTAPHHEVAEGDAPVYDRILLRQYLAQAEAERVRLEGALDAARHRRRTAELALRADLQTNDDLAADLDDLTRHLDEERQQTWHQVQAILAEAEVEAAAILASARDFAEEVLAGRTASRPTLGLIPGGAEPSPARALHPSSLGRLVG
jgi:hypothetical protein